MSRLRLFHGFRGWAALVAGAASLAGSPPAAASAAEMLDLSRAVVVVPSSLREPERNAVGLLVDDVARRSGIRWKVLEQWPGDGRPVVAVGPAAAAPAFAGPFARTMAEDRGRDRPKASHSHRGRGAGGARGRQRRARRALRRGPAAPRAADGPGSRALARGLPASRPARAIRCAAISSATGPRPTPTTAGTFPGGSNTSATWRSSAPTRSSSSPLAPTTTPRARTFPRPPLEMMVGMSRLLDDYGLDVWIWYPAMDKDYSDPATVAAALQEWDEVFRRLPRLDAVFVPGGDPGHTAPAVLMPFLAKVAEVLHRSHPRATMWVSPQGFNQEWLDQFLADPQEGRARLADAASSTARRCGSAWPSSARPSRRGTRFATTPTSPTASSASSPCPTGTWPSP